MQAHFQRLCAKCHGGLGRGDGESAATLVDNDRYPIRPRDLTSGVFKGSPAPEHLYRRILLGIPGTPMPSLPENMAGRETWDLVHFVLSLSGSAQRKRAELRRFRIVAQRVDKLPDHPDTGAWRSVESTALHLMPLWWRYQRPDYLTAAAVHDGKDVAMLLVWGDETDNDLVVRPQDFRDAVAVQFSLASDEPPFFAMGEKERPVNIWMWKGERQADLTGFHDLDSQYPNVGIDSYPNIERAPYEQPARRALTTDSDPTFITAWGAGNLVADPRRRSAAEDLVAHGFGTLRGRDTQQVVATGAWRHGSHRVMFRRSLSGVGDNAVNLAPGSSVPIAFAVWNGAAGDRDGQKSVSIWQDLLVEE